MTDTIPITSYEKTEFNKLSVDIKCAVQILHKCHGYCEPVINSCISLFVICASCPQSTAAASGWSIIQPIPFLGKAGYQYLKHITFTTN